VAGFKKVRGPTHPDATQSMGYLATLYRSEGQYAKAEAVLREMLAAREAFRPAAWTTANTRAQLGDVLYRQQKYAEAEPLLLAGYAGLKQHEEGVPPPTRGVAFRGVTARLVLLYEATGKPAEAAKWRAVAAAYREVAPPPRPAR
jgi:hypothetical protein